MTRDALQEINLQTTLVVIILAPIASEAYDLTSRTPGSITTNISPGQQQTRTVAVCVCGSYRFSDSPNPSSPVNGWRFFPYSPARIEDEEWRAVVFTENPPPVAAKYICMGNESEHFWMRCLVVSAQTRAQDWLIVAHGGANSGRRHLRQGSSPRLLQAVNVLGIVLVRLPSCHDPTRDEDHHSG